MRSSKEGQGPDCRPHLVLPLCAEPVFGLMVRAKGMVQTPQLSTKPTLEVIRNCGEAPELCPKQMPDNNDKTENQEPTKEENEAKEEEEEQSDESKEHGEHYENLVDDAILSTMDEEGG